LNPQKLKKLLRILKWKVKKKLIKILFLPGLKPQKRPPEPSIRELSSSGVVWIEWDQSIYLTKKLKFLIEAGAIAFSIDSNYA